MRKMQVKSTMSERLSSKIEETTSVGKEVEKRECLCTTGVIVSRQRHYENQYGDSTNTKIELPYS